MRAIANGVTNNLSSNAVLNILFSIVAVAILSPSRHVFTLAAVIAVSVTIMNVTKCCIYSRVATILLPSLLSVASNQG